MSVDDRIRSATEATAATVREVPPLTLPDELPGHLAPGRPRRDGGRWRGWGGWLVPLAAAVAVIAVAATLIAVRGLGAGHASGPAPAQSTGVPASLPRYGVVLTQATATIGPPIASPGTRVAVSDLAVTDTRTGQRVAVVKHPANFGFETVSGAADDRTFALTASSYNHQPLPGTKDAVDVQSFYLLRVAPGSSQPAKLTRLSIPSQPGDATIAGFALSPDGRTLAVLEWCTLPGAACDRNSPGTLRLYSVATGKAERTWTWGALPYPLPGYSGSSIFSNNTTGLTWLSGGRTLAFTYYAHGQAPVVRTLLTTRPGGDLVAASRPVFTLPSRAPDACAEAQLTPDGQTVICGTQLPANTFCKTATLEIDAYSVATGKRQGVLYRFSGKCSANDGIGALGWVGPGNTVVATVVASPGHPGKAGFNTEVTVGVLSRGKLIPVLPGPLPLSQGPGAVAF